MMMIIQMMEIIMTVTMILKLSFPYFVLLFITNDDNNYDDDNGRERERGSLYCRYRHDLTDGHNGI